MVKLDCCRAERGYWVRLALNDQEPEITAEMRADWEQQRQEEEAFLNKMEARQEARRKEKEWNKRWGAYANSVASNGHRRMAKRRNRPGIDRVTVHAIKGKQAMFDGCCAYCGCKPDRLAMDHFLPLSRGGFHTPSNLIPACKSCNSSKSNKEVQAWFKAQPFYSADRWALILERMTEQGQMALF